MCATVLQPLSRALKIALVLEYSLYCILLCFKQISRATKRNTPVANCYCTGIQLNFPAIMPTQVSAMPLG